MEGFLRIRLWMPFCSLVADDIAPGKKRQSEHAQKVVGLPNKVLWLAHPRKIDCMRFCQHTAFQRCFQNLWAWEWRFTRKHFYMYSWKITRTRHVNQTQKPQRLWKTASNSFPHVKKGKFLLFTFATTFQKVEEFPCYIVYLPAFTKMGRVSRSYQPLIDMLLTNGLPPWTNIKKYEQ